MSRNRHLFDCKICGILVLVSFLQIRSGGLPGANNIYNHVFINPTTILDTLLAPITDKDAREEAERAFEQAIITRILMKLTTLIL